MCLSKLSIRNFRNFTTIDIWLAGNVVLLGENRVGKSNPAVCHSLGAGPDAP